MSAGLLASAQSLLAGLLALGRTRLELFSTELQEEIARQAAALLGAFVVLGLAGLGAAFAAMALLIAVGDEYRLTASIGVAAFFFVLAAAAAWSLRRVARRKPRPFQASIDQLERDCEALKP